MAYIAPTDKEKEEAEAKQATDAKAHGAEGRGGGGDVLTRIHVGLRVCALEDGAAGAASSSSCAASSSSSSSATSAPAPAVPVGDEWVVTVPPPAAGTSDFLILCDRYEWATRQWEMCVDVLAEGSKLAMRSPYLTDDRGYGKFDWFEGHVAASNTEPDNLWESLWISWGGGEDGDKRKDETTLAPLLLLLLTRRAAAPPPLQGAAALESTWERSPVRGKAIG